jgi:hypothetical protein
LWFHVLIGDLASIVFQATFPRLPLKIIRPGFLSPTDMQWVQPFGKNRDAPGQQWFQISHWMGYPRVALSPVIYFMFSSGSLTLPAITIHSESVALGL